MAVFRATNPFSWSTSISKPPSFHFSNYSQGLESKTLSIWCLSKENESDPSFKVVIEGLKSYREQVATEVFNPKLSSTYCCFAHKETQQIITPSVS
ncbi:Structural maintenance of chromosomes protein 3 [Bienertia sinuspersici]